MLNNFIYTKKKSLFTKELEAGNVLDEAIVFIEDTKEIWNHGTYFDCSTTDFDQVLKNYALKSELTNYVDKTTAQNYVDKTTGQTISGLKTFTNHININNQSRIRSNIDPGELKITRVNDDKGFIIRVNKNSSDSILPLEILSTNGTSSYQYNFPKSSGTVALGVKKNGQIINANLTDGLIDLGDGYVQTTYANLKALRDNSQLITGQKYRITDYKTTAQALTGISVADHRFDIVVEALTPNTLSETAHAINSSTSIGQKKQDLFSLDMNPGNWQQVSVPEIQSLTDLTIYVQQGTRTINQAGIVKVRFTAVREDPETDDVCIGADLVKDGQVVAKDYHVGRINYNPWQEENNIYYLPVTESGSYIIRYYVVGASSGFETNLKVTAEAYDGIDYFANSNLNAWEIKYCLDADTNRFQWASITSDENRGVIYYMKDEHDNEAPYDFKNILFNEYYTFSYTTSSEEIQDASVKLSTCYANKIKGCYSVSNSQKLNKIVFKTTNAASICGYNEFGGNCENITFGDNCSSNSFGAYCKNITFGDSCSYNKFQDYCQSNTFGNFCQSNTFGIQCQNNTFGSYILRITFGRQCQNCKFSNNESGNDLLLEACRMIKFGDQCNGVNLYCTEEPSYGSGNWLQNIEVSNGLSGNIQVSGLNKPYVINITKNTSGNIVQTCHSDHYIKSSTGIPKSDLDSSVQTSLEKADTALQSYTEQYKGTVTGVKINGSSKSPSNGIVDLGTVITSHQDISGKQDALISGENIKTINGESILGNGDITISIDSSSGNGAYAEVSHGTSDTTFTLTPNTFHVWENINNSLTLLLGEEIDEVMNEYVFQFSWSSNLLSASLSLPSTVKWADDIIPDFSDTSFIYQVSIVNNCATMLKFKK